MPAVSMLKYNGFYFWNLKEHKDMNGSAQFSEV